MKAVLIDRYGDADELKYRDVPVPEVNADEVLIKVFATSINPVDWKIRQGMMNSLPWAFPMILGWDVSGVVEKVGSAVAHFRPGDEVYAFPTLSPKGTYAEYVSVKAGEVAHKPQKLDHLQAASLPLAGLTARQALFDHGGLQAGQKILINGAAGGVGTLAIQLAKNNGAYIIGTASQRNVDFLKGLGADEVIDYTKENVEEQLRDIDLVLDCIGGENQKQLVKVLKPGGMLVSIVGLNSAVDFSAKQIRTAFFMTKPSSGQLQLITALADIGKLIPVIAHTLELEDIQKAHRISEAGHVRGKIVLNVASK
jgi:NADPH:quinone reductase-like Zn-dependent oxidoreductase